MESQALTLHVLFPPQCAGAAAAAQHARRDGAAGGQHSGVGSVLVRAVVVVLSRVSRSRVTYVFVLVHHSVNSKLCNSSVGRGSLAKNSEWLNEVNGVGGMGVCRGAW